MKYIYLFAILFLMQCSKVEYAVETNYQNATAEGFNDYWYKGLAELNSYALEQARYGQVHEGEAVLIFVTEDFSKSKQVKLDNPQAVPNDTIKVLKLNFTKKFLTGIYPYSLMMSVFTPVDQQVHPNSLKVSTTAQDWCGHSFEQMNLAKNNFDVTIHSYFEAEGDKKISIKKALLEDEIWNMIRLNPENLPTGNIEVVLGTFFSRLKHKVTKVTKAKATLTAQGDSLMVYGLDYPEYKRDLKLTYTKAFPHKIMSFEEIYHDGFGANAKKITTKGTLKESITLDYWNKHFNEDRKYRAALGL